MNITIKQQYYNQHYQMIILGIETSCDETALALYDSNKGIIGHVLHSQIDIHSKYGGVVPELASRDHTCKIVPLLSELLLKTQIDIKNINLVAFTNGPGLMGPLLTGAAFAKTLGWTLGIKSIEINHLEAHIFSAMMTEPKLEPPFLSLLVSGGHTFLSVVSENNKYKIIGKTLDDSAGEVFDKIARQLGLGYPGGPEISKAAEKTSRTIFKFPRPMSNSGDYNFSFSGLKTHVNNVIKETKLTDQTVYEISLDFENAIIDVLIKKTLKAAQDLNIKNIVVVGGVSANTKLRSRFKKEKNSKDNIYFPDLQFSTDNGAMIAYLGWMKSKLEKNDSLEIRPNPSLKII